MLTFPNCKLNLGLHVVEKRADGFHDIESVFYPVNWCDALEVIECNDCVEEIRLTQSGLDIQGSVEDNLIYKAWKMLSGVKRLPPLKVHLHKTIPMGAGLGGGSADAAFFINLVNEKFQLSLSNEERWRLASELGSDCAFFIQNQPVLAQGRGNEFSPVHVDLSAYYVLVVFPGIHSNTAEAYRHLTPKQPLNHLRDIVEKEPPEAWPGRLVNDFEESIFIKYPLVGSVKQMMYDRGAVYASMSGSGSSVYGIFKTEPEIRFPDNFNYYLQKPAQKIL